MKRLFITGAIGLILTALTGTAWLWQARSHQPIAETSASPEAWPSVIPTATANLIANAPDHVPAPIEAGTGRIEGPVSYPGEAIPPDLRVCAENLDTASIVCIGQLRDSRFPGGLGYRLTVPPGRYQVFAQSDTFEPGYRAYYSAFVTCGYQVGCTDHSPLTVKVAAGGAATGIEPGDFYR